jgi:CRP/FNR family transcriptional regulator, anaerobic regulatory protein
MIPEFFTLAIDKLSSLSEKERVSLSSYIHIKTFMKGDLLLRQDEVCKCIYFIISGTVIYYQITNNGEETTTDFAFDGEWVTDNRSRITQTPSHLNIKAWDTTQVAIIQQCDLDILFTNIPSLERVVRLSIEQAYVKLAQWSIDLQTLSAEERYQKLVEKSPQVFQRLPLYHIANYLGIAPKSLSRIRNKKRSSD